MPQVFAFKIKDQQATVIYPDGKKVKGVKYQESDDRVVVYYHPPHVEPDFADPSPSEPFLYVVVSALVRIE